ncbi:MAG TPA: hypothetical protein VMG10_10005 [Gemmataceae bacterium]|nr:hypothetical protein [Gemmataceae bacterium]
MYPNTHQRIGIRGRACWAALAALLIHASAAPAAEVWRAFMNPDNSLSFSFYHSDQRIFRMELIGWGPRWAWVGVHSRQKAEGDRLSTRVPFVVNKDKGEVIDVQFQAWQPAPRQVAFRYDLDAAQDVPLTQLIAGFGFEANSSQGTLTLSHDGRKPSKFSLPIRGIHETPAAAKAELAFSKADTVTMKIDPPCPIRFDNGMRVVLASDVYRKGKRHVTLTLTFPEETAFYATHRDFDKLTRKLAGPDWFAFQPSKKVTPGVLDMDSWLDRPAGKHGSVRMVKDRFAFEDGTPVKFWGVNLSYTANAPDKATADFTAARFAKYGINAVRMHKFSYPTGQMGIGDPNDSTRMDPKGMDQLDYFVSRLKEHGVYFGWSHTYGFRVVPGDRKRLLAYDEIAKNRKGNTYAFIHFAEDVQDLMIDMVVNLLKHKNPYTGRTYADEPALCFLELQNEDDIFFYTSEGAFNSCPTYKKRFMERFATWLKERYGSQEKLKEAWGDALKDKESLTDSNIVPQLNPWLFGADNLPKQKGGARRRLLDTAAFLHHVQDRFYSRFVKAIRDAGYKGPLNGSPWQAPSMLPHYYNLCSDYLVGYIDRHNYFEGAGPGMFASMLTRPGSGYFSSGLQQVIDRPFGLSEWIHVYPNVYAAEGPAILAAYGMGLQGWDASYEFQSQAARRVFGDTAGGFPWGVWEADVPTSLGQYPSLARMIYRGDVKEGDVISVRRVSAADLAEGRFSFSDKVEQRGDVKTFGGSVPPDALAAGRVVVEFPDKSQPSQLPDMSRYRRGSVIRSVTEQLAWDTSGKGFFTVNTAGTKAVVGFAEGKEQKLGDVRIQLDCPFASLFLTALDRDADLANSKRALITVLARESNTDFSYFTPDNKVMNNGRPPILLEPVKATVSLAGRPIEAVNILDHDGRRTGRTVTVQDGRFTIDGTKDKAIYYEVVFR